MTTGDDNYKDGQEEESITTMGYLRKSEYLSYLDVGGLT